MRPRNNTAGALRELPSGVQSIGSGHVTTGTSYGLPPIVMRRTSAARRSFATCRVRANPLLRRCPPRSPTAPPGAAGVRGVSISCSTSTVPSPRRGRPSHLALDAIDPEVEQLIDRWRSRTH